MKKYCIYSLLCFFFVSNTALAQITVSGTITDAKTAQPIPGVSVYVKSTTNGTTSDLDGKYTLIANSPNPVLVFSFIGYTSQEYPVSTASMLDVKLKEDVIGLDEVVVTGLASTIKRSNLANSVATISSKELAGVTTAQTLDGAIIGKITGMNINANSGAPGGGLNVKMRGITTIVAESQPLYIVDGIYVDNSFSSAGLEVAAGRQGGGKGQDNTSNRIADIPLEDVENIEVLKGASAAAIYGSRASRGVVIITTKQGKKGPPKFSVCQDIGFAKASHLLGMRQYSRESVDKIWGTQGVNAYDSAMAAGGLRDYEKELYGNTGLLSNTRISLSGGDEKTTFFFGGGIKSEEGIIARTGYNRQNFLCKLSHKISKKFTLGFNSGYIHSSADRGYTNNDNNGSTFGSALAATPAFVNLFPDASGKYPDNPFGSSNVLQTRDMISNNETVNRTLNGLSLTVHLLQRERSSLKLIARGGLDSYTLRTRAVFPRDLQFQKDLYDPGTGDLIVDGLNGISIEGNNTHLSTNAAVFLVHNYSLKKYYFTSQLGATAEDFTRNEILNTASGLLGLQTNVDQANNLQVSQFRSMQHDRGVFVQEEVTYDEKITLTAGVRTDKSSNNGNVNQLFAFPKASVAVNLSRFSFWKYEQVSQLKLRMAYGQSGNFPTFGSRYTTLTSNNISTNAGLLINTTRGNKNIKPERQTEVEGGVDITAFNEIVTLEATCYVKNVDDLLLNAVVPGSSGYTTQWLNAAGMENKGVELGLSLLPFRHDNFQWLSKISWWKNKAVVTRLDIPPFITGAFTTASLGTFRIEQGQSPTQIVGTVDTSGATLVKLGDAEPKFQLSFTNEFTIYKNLQFSFLVHWKNGGDNINLTQLLFDLGGTSEDYDANGQTRIDSYNKKITGPLVQEASYVKIREIGLHYSIPQQYIEKWFGKYVSGIRAGMSVNNLFTFTKYKGYDPEVSNFSGNGISSGVDVAPYPSSKRMFFHLSVDF